MAEELIIEYNGQIYRFDSFPVHIGRALNNELVVKAPLVADYHAVIDKTAKGLQVRSLAKSYLDGKRISTTGTLFDNAILQLGTAGLKIWLYPEKTMPSIVKKSPFWALFTHPVTAWGWFIAAVILSTWGSYLNSAQTYIMDYETPLVVICWIAALTWVIHSMILPLSRRYLVLPVLGLVSAYITFGVLADDVADWYGFQFNTHYGDAVSAVGVFVVFAWVYYRFLHDFVPLAGPALWRAAVLSLLPVMLFTAYVYLKQNDFFKVRPGSYPAYQTTLQQHIFLKSHIKSLNELLAIDKTKDKS